MNELRERGKKKKRMNRTRSIKRGLKESMKKKVNDLN